jgi:hypothetical protein
MTPERDIQSLTATPRRKRRVETRKVELHVCRECSSQLVYPTFWEQSGEERWTVELRCPECEHTVTGSWAQPVLDRFDLHLEEATQSVLDDLMTLSRVNFEEDVERFVAALHEDLILPIDF